MRAARPSRWNWRVYQKVARNAVASDLEYRSHYMILLVSSVITIIMELALFRQVYAGRSTVGHLPVELVPSFIVLGLLIRTGASLWSLIYESIEQIRDGSFRRFLLQPIHYPSYFFAQALGPKLPTWGLGMITVLVLKMTPGFESLLPLAHLAPFLGALALTYFLLWQIYLMLVYLGFWIEEAQFLSTALNVGMGIFSGSLVPLDWLPPSLVVLLKLTPFPLLGDFPMRAGLGLLTNGEWLNLAVRAIAWIATMIVLNTVLRVRGLKSYEAFGG